MRQDVVLPHIRDVNATTRKYAQVTHVGSYIESIVPPRCRNPRDVTLETYTIIDIPVVDLVEAPVAFTFEDDRAEARSTIRLFEDGLYEIVTTNISQKHSQPVPFGSKHFPKLVDDSGHYGLSRGRDDFLEGLARQYGQLIIIDGYVWRPCEEPRYVVMTFGMGGNHGGTSLSIGSWDNPNLAASSYHRANDFTAAQTHAIEVAQERGDTKSVGWISSQEPSIRVHIADAVRLVVPPAETREIREVRSDLATATRAYLRKLEDPTRDEVYEADLFDRVVRLRRKVRKLTHDVAGVGRETRPYEDR